MPVLILIAGGLMTGLSAPAQRHEVGLTLGALAGGTRSSPRGSLAGQAVVRLKDYGLRSPSAALGAIGTKNEMTVEFLVLPSALVAVNQAGTP